jgi:hypothetical protein
MSVLLRVDGRDCDLGCHRAVPGTPCDCICRGAYHAVGSTDGARRKLIADHHLADVDDEQLAALLAAKWAGPDCDEAGPPRHLVVRAGEILRSSSERQRFLLVASMAREWWEAEAAAKTLDAGPGAQPVQLELG